MKFNKINHCFDPNDLINRVSLDWFEKVMGLLKVLEVISVNDAWC